MLTSDAPEQNADPRRPDAAAKVAALEEEIVQLKEAVAAHEEVGRAIGIIVAVGHLPPPEAWEVVRQISQRTNIKLRHVAVLLTQWGLNGELPAEVRSELHRQLRLRRDHSQAGPPDLPG
ncbi:ANTAR domain-containing protein [Streptomyces sp. NPDC102406]|uniref:ANTAR domain-containing protein n=1 Tax=Streptomyces sp. NPDC102406 TaxID=3366171 RepID=UPI003804E733